jgi:hypothetical protein
MEEPMSARKVMQAVVLVLLVGLNPGWAFALTDDAVLAKAGRSLVTVTAVDGQTGVKRSASGVVVRPRQVVTSCSLMTGRPGLEVGTDGRSLPASLLIADQEKDLCLLAVEGLSAPAVERGSTGELAMQVTVWAVGIKNNAAAIEPGVVTQLRGRKPPLIETTLLGLPETVGRGLFDQDGRCIGFTTLFQDEGQTVYFAAPVEWLDSLRADNGGNGVGTPIHWLKRAAMLEEAERWDKLRDWSRQWSATLPEEPTAWHTLGYACIVLKDLDGALAAFEHTVRINPGDLDGWSNLGYVYTDLDRFPEAIRAYREVVRINSQDVEGWSNLGMAYEASGDHEAALEAVRTLQQLDTEKAADLMLHLEGKH